MPAGTAYGEGADEEMNKKEEDARLEAKLAILKDNLKTIVETRERPIFTTALIAGDCVIMDVIMKMGYADKIKVIFIDTFFLFEESIAFMKETEEYYGFKANWYHCADCANAEEFYGAPPPAAAPPHPPGRRPPRPSPPPPALTRIAARVSLQTSTARLLDAGPRGLRQKVQGRAAAARDEGDEHRRVDQRPPPRRGAERASLPVWEGNKVNLLTHWSFEECWNYLRKYNVPYHPLHDVGFSSLGDVQVARPPPRPAPPRPAPTRSPSPASLHPAPLPPAALTVYPPASRSAPVRCRSRSG